MRIGQSNQIIPHFAQKTARKAAHLAQDAKQRRRREEKPGFLRLYGG
jgi:hypothetical protein